MMISSETRASLITMAKEQNLAGQCLTGWQQNPAGGYVVLFGEDCQIKAEQFTEMSQEQYFLLQADLSEKYGDRSRLAPDPLNPEPKPH